jgi:hypothetical protein
MIAALVGGLTGALTSIIVSFMVEQRRLRAEVALKVVEFLQESSRTMEVFLVQRDFRSRSDSSFEPETYREAKLRLRAIVLNDVLRAQVRIVFGEGDDLQSLTGILVALREIIERAWTTGDSAWSDLRTSIDVRMKQIDAARVKLERHLIDKPALLGYSAGPECCGHKFGRNGHTEPLATTPK